MTFAYRPVLKTQHYDFGDYTGLQIQVKVRKMVAVEPHKVVALGPHKATLKCNKN
jgi:hypothetical protein